MVLRSAFHFTRRRIKCSILPTLVIPRVWMATRIALGVSAAICLATRNNIHGDSEKEDTTTANSPADSSPLSFIAEKEMWEHQTRYLGSPTPEGLVRMYWYTWFETRIRIASRGSRTLISIFDGDLVRRVNIADIVQENLWRNLESLFLWYRLDHNTPHPVEHIDKPHPPPGAVCDIIEGAVKSSDEYVLNQLLGRVFSSTSKKNAVDAMRATSASCLVSALYEADVRLLHVASLGNMRGILGRPRETEDGKTVYDVHVLSVDHTPDNPAEKSHIQGLHSGEDVTESTELFGRPYTRALGDGKLKWSPGVQSRLHRDYLGAPPDPKIKTPPYISAQPDVNTIAILPGDFLVLSSHWLTECLTDEEVVGLVGVWLKKNQDHLYRKLDSSNPPEDLPTDLAVTLPEDLPVDLKDDKSVMYRRWNVPKRFINEDVNPATHLARNATGGADTDLRRALLQLAPFESEGNVKSLGIAVVFFE
ncbi:phosphatase 2C-like domain-containing protein [Mycena maculata]|uniref:Phosphatase 2C-like domain-containing protein n=1 Tax=Mycena maculata TaxID=230809 RepID=A0AAD7HDE0_9AGAR|nr:phosphatase 2C-like domain-containing protein [Mycena maculata]